MAQKKEAEAPITLKERPKASKTTKQTEFFLQTQKSDTCCKGSGNCARTAASTPNISTQETATHHLPTEVKKGPKTRIIVKYDVGYNN
jgi:hypothetical protein